MSIIDAAARVEAEYALYKALDLVLDDSEDKLEMIGLVIATYRDIQLESDHTGVDTTSSIGPGDSM